MVDRGVIDEPSGQVIQVASLVVGEIDAQARGDIPTRLLAFGERGHAHPPHAAVRAFRGVRVQHRRVLRAAARLAFHVRRVEVAIAVESVDGGLAFVVHPALAQAHRVLVGPTQGQRPTPAHQTAGGQIVDRIREVPRVTESSRYVVVRRVDEFIGGRRAEFFPVAFHTISVERTG